jgi:hypothetical protein
MSFALRSLVVAWMGISLLIAPFDCFGTTGLTQQAAECCAKGKCLPTKDSDDCCKRTVPDGHDFVMASGKVLVHVLTPLHAIAAAPCPLPTFSNPLPARLELAYSPPGSPGWSPLNLPLLI